MSVLSIESDVWWPILGICALHLPIQNAHTQQWTHTHTFWTHTHTHSNEHTHTAVNTHTHSSGQPFMLRRPGSSWGIGALLKGLTSVVVLKVERECWTFTPPTYNSCRPRDSNLQPLDYESNPLTIRPQCPTFLFSIHTTDKVIDLPWVVQYRLRWCHWGPVLVESAEQGVSTERSPLLPERKPLPYRHSFPEALQKPHTHLCQSPATAYTTSLQTAKNKTLSLERKTFSQFTVSKCIISYDTFAQCMFTCAAIIELQQVLHSWATANISVKVPMTQCVIEYLKD